ncbi:MAG: dihydropteroate synthase [Candidatus Peregrinibacteria bacterium]|nr:dihydropteroate synthase [Candidatus Peregrinibacteria bacterium]
MKKQVKIFGILNITPDSFSDGGQFIEPEKALAQASKLIADGADFIDIGGESTRPNAQTITPAQEWQRLEPILKALLKNQRSQIKDIKSLISLDTRNPETAQNFLNLGGQILNDVSGFQNPEMIKLAPQFKKVIVNHFPGKTTNEVHEQNIGSIDEVIKDLLTTKEKLVQAGCNPDNIILDPGIGFGKTMELNWELLEIGKHLPHEHILIGHSKKRFLGEQRFETEPNIKAAKIAIENGTEFLRVHDVKSHRELLNKK